MDDNFRIKLIEIKLKKGKFMYEGEKEMLLEELRKLRGNDSDDSVIVRQYRSG